MTDKEPTQEQIKEFWEWCGFRQNADLHQDYHYEFTKKVGNWHRPDGLTTFDQIQKGNLPSVDLNNLFKYAVPLAIDKIMAKQGCSSDLAYAILFKKWLQKLELAIPKHAETLFWAVRGVIKG